MVSLTAVIDCDPIAFLLFFPSLLLSLVTERVPHVSWIVAPRICYNSRTRLYYAGGWQMKWFFGLFYRCVLYTPVFSFGSYWVIFKEFYQMCYKQKRLIGKGLWLENELQMEINYGGINYGFLTSSTIRSLTYHLYILGRKVLEVAKSLKIWMNYKVISNNLHLWIKHNLKFDINEQGIRCVVTT